MGLLDYADAAGKRFFGLLAQAPDNARQMALAAYQLASDTAARKAAMGRLPKAFDESKSGRQMLDEAMNVGPSGLLGTFAGVNAKTANKLMLEAAQKMDKAGADRGAIWKETGWFKGPDSKWRFEIDDSKASFDLSKVPAQKSELQLQNEYLRNRGLPAHHDMGSPDSVVPKSIKSDARAYASSKASSGDTGAELREAFGHKELFDAYPTFPHILIEKENSFQTRGMFSGNKITTGGAETIGADAAREAKSTTLHELQHAIQGRENFAKGGTPAMLDLHELKSQLNDIVGGIELKMNAAQKAGDKKTFDALYKQRAQLLADDGYQAYRSLAGEAEARAVQNRSMLNADQRKRVAPWESYDIPWDQLIMRY